MAQLKELQRLKEQLELKCLLKEKSLAKTKDAQECLWLEGSAMSEE